MTGTPHATPPNKVSGEVLSSSWALPRGDSFTHGHPRSLISLIANVGAAQLRSFLSSFVKRMKASHTSLFWLDCLFSRSLCQRRARSWVHGRFTSSVQGKWASRPEEKTNPDLEVMNGICLALSPPQGSFWSCGQIAVWNLSVWNFNQSPFLVVKGNFNQSPFFSSQREKRSNYT